MNATVQLTSSMSVRVQPIFRVCFPTVINVIFTYVPRGLFLNLINVIVTIPDWDYFPIKMMRVNVNNLFSKTSPPGRSKEPDPGPDFPSPEKGTVFGPEDDVTSEGCDTTCCRTLSNLEPSSYLGQRSKVQEKPRMQVDRKVSSPTGSVPSSPCIRGMNKTSGK